MNEINESKFDPFIKENDLVLVDFSAEWCGPCKMQSPILHKLETQYKNKIKFVKIDIDKNPALASRYGISSVPSIMFFLNGKYVRFPSKSKGKVDKLIGVQQENKLKGIISYLLGKLS